MTSQNDGADKENRRKSRRRQRRRQQPKLSVRTAVVLMLTLQSVLAALGLMYLGHVSASLMILYSAGAAFTAYNFWDAWIELPS